MNGFASLPYLHAWSKEGTEALVGWPKLLKIYMFNTGLGNFVGQVKLLSSDLDNDGDIEVISATSSMANDDFWVNIFVYDTPGLASAGTWPLVNKDAHHSRGYEAILSQCSNGIDDDNDGIIDYPQDTGCTDGQDNDEAIVTLQQVMIDRRNVIVNYSKEFDTCAHLVSASSPTTVLHSQNYFCQRSATLTIPLSNFTEGMMSGQIVKLCHGNNYNNCSKEVRVRRMWRRRR
jgi:hypothetical protein